MVATATADSGTSIWLILAAIGASATALVTLGILAVNVIAHLHDRAVSGTSGALAVQKGLRTIPFKTFEPVKIRSDWERENIRWVPIRAVDRARYPIVLSGPVKCKLAFSRKVAYGTQPHPIQPDDPIMVCLILYKPGGWGRRKWFLLRAQWVATHEAAGLLRVMCCQRIPPDAEIGAMPPPPVSSAASVETQVASELPNAHS